MGGLEQVCSVIMVFAGTGTFLLMLAAVTIERQRLALARLQGERVKAAYRARTMRGLLARTFPPAVDVVVIWGGAA